MSEPGEPARGYGWTGETKTARFKCDDCGAVFVAAEPEETATNQDVMCPECRGDRDAGDRMTPWRILNALPRRVEFRVDGRESVGELVSCDGGSTRTERVVARYALMVMEPSGERRMRAIDSMEALGHVPEPERLSPVVYLTAEISFSHEILVGIPQEQAADVVRISLSSFVRGHFAKRERR